MFSTAKEISYDIQKTVSCAYTFVKSQLQKGNFSKLFYFKIKLQQGNATMSSQQRPCKFYWLEPYAQRLGFIKMGFPN